MADEAAQRVPSGSPESQTVEFETSYRIYFTGQTSGAQRASMIESIRTAGRDILSASENINAYPGTFVDLPAIIDFHRSDWDLQRRDEYHLELDWNEADVLFFVAIVDWAEGRILTDDDWLENKDHWLLAVHLDESDQGDVESLRLPLDACSVFVASSSAESSSHMAEGKAGI